MKFLSLLATSAVLAFFSATAFPAHAHTPESSIYFVKNTTEGLFYGSDADPL